MGAQPRSGTPHPVGSPGISDCAERLTMAPLAGVPSPHSPASAGQTSMKSASAKRRMILRLMVRHLAAVTTTATGETTQAADQSRPRADLTGLHGSPPVGGTRWGEPRSGTASAGAKDGAKRTTP